MIARCVYHIFIEGESIKMGDYAVAKKEDHTYLILHPSLSGPYRMMKEKFDKHFVEDKMNASIESSMNQLKWKLNPKPQHKMYFSATLHNEKYQNHSLNSTL